MNRYTAVILSVWLVALTLVVSAPAAAHNADPTIRDWVPAMNQPSYWETNGWECSKHAPDANPIFPTVLRPTKTIYKGGQFVNVYRSNTVVYAPHVHRIGQPPAAVSWWMTCFKPPKDKPVLRYGGRILGPCGDPFYTARIWNGQRSTRPVTIILEVRQTGRVLFKRTLQPGQSVKPRAQWVPGGRTLILRRGNGDIIDRERTVTGTFSWRECRNG